MTQLNSRNRTFLTQKCGDRREAGNLVVGPESEVASGPSTISFDGGGLCIDQACSAHGETTEVYLVPVVDEPIERSILAHR